MHIFEDRSSGTKKNFLPILTTGVLLTSLVGFGVITNINTDAALPAPGGVDSSLSLWLNAADGVDTGEFEGEDPVESWDDLSGSGNHAVPGGEVYLYEDSVNNNPGVNFYDDEFLNIASTLNFDTINDFTVFTVTNQETYVGDGDVPIFGPQSGSNSLTVGFENDFPYIDNAGNGAIVESIDGAMPPSLLRASRSGDDFELFAEGSSMGSTNSAETFGAENMRIGASGTTGFMGDINEVVVYNTTLTPTQISQVESYLALKYGLTLGNTSNDYLNSAGESVFDNDDSSELGDTGDGQNDWRNVLGLGKDVNSGLDQRISETQDEYGFGEGEGEGEGGLRVKIATEANFEESTNLEMADTFGDGEYVIIGDDDEGTYFERSFDEGDENMLDTTWKAEQTGDAPEVYISIDGDDFYEVNLGLVVSDDDNFTESDTIIPLSSGEGGRIGGPSGYFEVQFNEGVQYFTLIDIEPGIMVNKEVVEVVEEGEAEVVEVSLKTAPMEGDVEVELDLQDPDKVGVDVTNLTFTYENWNVPQEVMISGLSDEDQDDELSEIEFGIGEGNMSYEYDDIEYVEVDVDVLDDDNPSNDNDGDGVSNGEEAQAPNDGDANGDGTSDGDQENVASSVSSDSGEFVTLEGTGSCQTVNDFEVVSESSLGVEDTDNNFDFGLTDFEFQCPTPGQSVDVTIIWDQEYDTSTWRYRKFDGTNYIDIDDQVTYGTRTVGGVIKTTSSYTITDGGPLDLDGAANGVIVDPAGPGFEVTTTSEDAGAGEGDGMSGLIRTGGFNKRNNLMLLAFAPVLIIGLAWEKLRRSK